MPRGIVVAILRLVYCYTVDLFEDETYASLTLNPWLIVEPAAYFIFAILPGLRSLSRYVSKSANLSDKVSMITEKMFGASHATESSKLQRHPKTPLTYPPAIHKSTEISVRVSPAVPQRSRSIMLEELQLQSIVLNMEPGIHMHRDFQTISRSGSGQARSGVFDEHEEAKPFYNAVCTISLII